MRLADLAGVCSGPYPTPWLAAGLSAARCGASGRGAQCPSHAELAALAQCPQQPSGAHKRKMLSTQLHNANSLCSQLGAVKDTRQKTNTLRQSSLC